MVIPDMRLSPVCSARATALQGQRRTADPVPDWLRVPTWMTFHPARAIVKSWDREWLNRSPGIRVLLSGRRAFSLKEQRPNIIPVSPPEGPQSSEVGGELLSPSESEAWQRLRRCVRELVWPATGRVDCARGRYPFVPLGEDAVHPHHDRRIHLQSPQSWPRPAARSLDCDGPAHAPRTLDKRRIRAAAVPVLREARLRARHHGGHQRRAP